MARWDAGHRETGAGDEGFQWQTTFYGRWIAIAAASRATHPSLLMLRHPFAGHALGLGELVGGHGVRGSSITDFY